MADTRLSDLNYINADTGIVLFAVDDTGSGASGQGKIKLGNLVNRAGELFLWTDTGEPTLSRGLECDGMLYDTGTPYKRLYQAIGTKYGSGTNQFATPNYTGRNVFLRAADGTTILVGDTGGDAAPGITGATVSFLRSPTGGGGGAFTQGSGGATGAANAGAGTGTLSFDAQNATDSGASDAYGRADEVRPHYSAVRIFIRY